MEDPLVTCPFEEVHRFNKSRMQFHMVKCAKNHKLNGKLRCPYNPLHIVAANEMLQHCKECTNIASIYLQAYASTDKKCFSGEISVAAVQQTLDEILPENCDWQKKHTIKGPGYDPQVASSSRQVYRQLNCESKSKREKFRMEERARFEALEQERAKELQPQPLRRPHTESIVLQEKNILKGTAGNKLNIKVDEYQKMRLPKSAISATSAEAADDLSPEYIEKLKAMNISGIDYGKTYLELEEVLNEKQRSIEEKKRIQKEKKEMIEEENRIIKEEEQKVKEQKKQLIDTLKMKAAKVDNASGLNGTSNNADTNGISYASIASVCALPRQNPKCAATFGPTSSASSSEQRGVWGNTNGTPQFGRGIVHAYNQKIVSNTRPPTA